MHLDNDLNKLLNEIDYDNPYDTFNNNYDKSGDYKKMQTILNEVKKYDIYDFISRVSALNLVPENQNKSILIDALISSLLTLQSADYTSTYKMSSGKFRKIINQIDNMKLKMSIDPSENIFIENVMFYDNYFIFTGINYLPGYSLQMLIYILFLHKNNFNFKFLKLAKELIELVLNVSNKAASELEYKFVNIKKVEVRNIVIPESSKLEFMANLITIDNDYIRDIFKDDFIIEQLYSNFGHGDIETALNPDKQEFFSKPFIKANENKTIILNISVLSSFVFYKIILLADDYGHKEELINRYNMIVWNDCRKSLDVLGHKKIKEKDLEIDLLERNDYKEVLLNVCNNQIMILTFICDDGKDYSEGSMFSKYSSDKFSELLEKRIPYISDKLNNQGIENKDIFHIISINTLGRGISIYANRNYYYEPLILNPFELRCIAINEKSEAIFLPRYIRAKSKLLNNEMLTLFSELNSIEIYVNNNYSFYLNDDFNPKKHMLYIGPGDSIDYIIRANNKERRHLVESFKDGYYTEVVLNDKERNIFGDLSWDVPRASLLVEFSNVIIWIYSPEIDKVENLNLYFSIIDAISYWISECKDIIERYNFEFEVIKLQIELIGNLQECYYDIDETINWIDEVNFEINENSINLILTPESFRTLNCKDNNNEKLMIETIIDILGNFTIEGTIDKKHMDSIFENPLKKKFFTLDYITNPYLKPLTHSDFRKIKSEDENELLDDIGTTILNSGKWTYGIVKDEDRTIIANYVVGHLYNLLQKEISELQPDNFVELVCNDLEIVMYNLMLAQSRYSLNVACYPEKQEKILDDFNELNKTSRAQKFFIEYIAACPPSGTCILGEWQYERLLAICSLIIDWAYKNDLFYYNIFKTQVEVLQSDRIGMKQDEFNKLKEINIKTREEQLSYNPMYDVREDLPHEEFPNIEEELNIAFLDEYEFSFDDFCNTIFAMITLGDEINNEVKKFDRNELILRIVEDNTNVNGKTIEKVIQYISLTKREDFLKPGQPYRKEDVYPWRFNRELSFTRRPVIIRENEVIWGNRQLFHMLKFTIDLIYEGKLKTRGRKLTKLIGKITNKRGEDFNNRVYNKINGLKAFIVDKNLKKINHKKIADENGNTLGDIDVLYINLERKRIVLAEVKDFDFAKSPYEMDCEYRKMFLDEEDKNCFATKHRRRASWVNEHWREIKEQYNLEGDGWSVKDIFIVNKAIISNAFYDAGATIITYGEISKERLQNV